MKPEEIEALSFKIIDKEAGSHGFTERQWQVVRRMIHTSADFEWLQVVRFHPDAIQAGIEAIRRGQTIVTDTQMARMGIRRQPIESHGGSIQCHMSDPAVANAAQKAGSTRARAAVDAALAHLTGGIYAIGNAPTALLRLIELVQQGLARPALIIGLPVGFVNAAESKQALMQLDLPYISNVGRKGGSTLAASVVNALALMAGANARYELNRDDRQA
jgi:precorrin-8X/cobalt-precorrin-8 methylmutase